MSAPLEQHQLEIHRNLRAWHAKPLLREIYSDFYRRLKLLINPAIPGRIVEIGSGIGSLKWALPDVLTTDLFPNPWIDLVCDAYQLPFPDGSLSHLVLFDVFHHLWAPNAFLREARRALAPAGRVLLLEPYVSWSSFPVYGLFHHEPVAWRKPLNLADAPPCPPQYYAAQGNATRLFFRREVPGWPEGWTVFHAQAFACFAFLLSGGYSRPAFYPARCLLWLQKLDRLLSRWPRLFAGRCLLGLEKPPVPPVSAGKSPA